MPYLFQCFFVFCLFTHRALVVGALANWFDWSNGVDIWPVIDAKTSVVWFAAGNTWNTSAEGSQSACAVLQSTPCDSIIARNLFIALPSPRLVFIIAAPACGLIASPTSLSRCPPADSQHQLKFDTERPLYRQCTALFAWSAQQHMVAASSEYW